MIALLPAAVGVVAVLLGGRRVHMIRFAPALLFHAVPESKIPGLSHTTASKFERFASRLARDNIGTLTVSQACRRGNTTGAHERRSVILTFDDAFADFYSNVFPVLTRHGMTVTIFPVVSYLGAESSWDIYRPRPHLGKEQLVEIASAGHEIGSHTITHPDLLLLSTDEVRRELAESKQILEEILGKQVATLSFPFGRWSRRIWNVARECGYRNATVYGNHVLPEENFVRVVGVYSFDSAEEIIEKALGGRWTSNTMARSRVMPHFAKGSAIWRFRPAYNVLRLFKA